MKHASLRIAIALLAAFLFAPIATVSAHQSGCHRWHSCPSDSGSYVCGDLGYYSQCDTSYEDETDYESLGSDDGSDYVSSNDDYIVSKAQAEAQSDGAAAGSANEYSSPSPDASVTCADIKYNSTSLPSEYYTGFEDSYRDGCTENYDQAYETAYTTAYDTALAEYEAQQSKEELQTEDVASSDDSNSDTLWGGGFLLLVCGGFVYSWLTDRPKNK